MHVYPRVVAVASLALLLASPASAQVFVSGGPFANVLRFGGYSSQSPTIYEEDISGTSAGVRLAVGGLIASHAVLEVEIAVPNQIHTDVPPGRSLYPAPPPNATPIRTVDFRTRHASILAGYQTAERHHVRAALLAGVMLIEERTRSVTTYDPSVPYLLPSDSTMRYKRIAPVFGFDLPCALTRHFAVVPQMRLYRSGATTYGALGLWPGVSARLTF